MVATEIAPLIAQMGGPSAQLLQVLLAVQDSSLFNYVSEDDVTEIARAMNISRSRVYSTASFYSEIALFPRGRHLIRVCGNAPCENAGREAIYEALCAALGVSEGETTPDQLFTLERVSCLGACWMSPAIKIDQTIYGDMTPEKAVELVESLRKEHANAISA